MDMKAINEQVIRQHRAGEELSVPGMHRERIVLLTTTGAKSGRPTTAPMLFVPSDAAIIVIASNDGAPRPPQWYRNLLADPAVHVEEPEREYDGISRVLDGDEHSRAWATLIAGYPFLVDQQEKAGRELPLVEIVEA